MPEFEILNNNFVYNGQRLRVLSGAIHYFRVVPEYWRDRLLKLKACGLNTVETYVAWNVHEPEKGHFNFEGMADIVGFINIAQELGLHVIVRPGPFICAEWEFGGLPAWLLKEENIKLRCYNRPYLERVDIFFDVLFDKLKPLLCTNGGPIIAIQVENEYGSYGNDNKYLEYLKNGILNRGVDVLLFTSDGPTDLMLQSGTLPGVLKTVNFGSDSKGALEKLRQYQKDGPAMCMEYWNGWFDHWGEEHHKRDEKDAAEELDNMLKLGFSLNFYMFHGGTNFGFYNGANYQENYAPTITSYDYDSPISEDGDLTPKYYAYKEVLAKYTEIEKVELLPPAGKTGYGEVKFSEKQGLFESLTDLSEIFNSSYPVPMEQLNQNYGFILYRTRVKGPRLQCEADIKDVRDRAMVFVNQRLVDIIYRADEPRVLKLDFKDEENTLDILVENMGRVNYGRHIMDRKGITESVRLDYQFQFDWDIFTLPLDNTKNIKYENQYKEDEPAFYRGYFEVDCIKDTYLDTRGWQKGTAFINGFNIGRYWNVGPQRTLYIPAPLLKKGKNEIVLFELQGTEEPKINLIDRHILASD